MRGGKLADCCLTLGDFAGFLEIHPSLAYGIGNTCVDDCDSPRPWPALHRSSIRVALAGAISDIQDRMGIDICPRERELTVDYDCPIELPADVCYVGHKEEVGETTISLCLNYLSAHSDYLQPDCDIEDIVGQLILNPSQFPVGWEWDPDLVEFDYTLADCRYDACLAPPCYNYPCLPDPPAGDSYYKCATPCDCEGAEPGSIVASWPLWELLRPDQQMLAYKCGSTQNRSKFIGEVKVTFYEINEDDAVTPVDRCTCGACETPECEDAFDWTVNEDLTELCIQSASGCECISRQVKIRYGTCPEIPPNVLRAVFLRTLTYVTPRKCGCGFYDDILKYWTELDPGVANEALSTITHYPFGKSRAGVALLTILEGYNKKLEREERTYRTGGLFTAHA